MDCPPAPRISSSRKSFDFFQHLYAKQLTASCQRSKARRPIVGRRCAAISPFPLTQRVLRLDLAARGPKGGAADRGRSLISATRSSISENGQEGERLTHTRIGVARRAADRQSLTKKKTPLSGRRRGDATPLGASLCYMCMPHRKADQDS